MSVGFVLKAQLTWDQRNGAAQARMIAPHYGCFPCTVMTHVGSEFFLWHPLWYPEPARGDF